ncbi:MAG TPA: flagellar assembly protein FliH [Exilispira sp.]|nr:flagellar assembly protein FliH [Exilispira sp.]
MAKNVLKNDEIKKIDKKFIIPPPKIKSKEEVVEVVEGSEVSATYKGPSIEDVKMEIDKLKQDWKIEYENMRRAAEEEAKQIIQKAEDLAFAKIKESKAQANIEIDKIKQEAQKILDEAKLEAKQIIETAEKKSEEIIEENRKKGYDEGYEDGFNKGNEEVKHLIERLHKIISEVIAKRQEIIEGTEYQIISIVLLIVKKIIKIITENQKTVIINNVVEALKKVKGTKNIIIRVNLDDIAMVTKHKEDFIKMIEGLEGIQFLEDSSIERGGCIIETDFGEIDARISLQLKEIEDKILELMPIKKRMIEESK